MGVTKNPLNKKYFMRHTTTSRMNDVVDRYNSVPAYRFSIRGQHFDFQTKAEYDLMFNRALEIADKQKRWIESGRCSEEFDVEEALRDSDQEEFNFDNFDPNERLVDDVMPGHR